MPAPSRVDHPSKLTDEALYCHAFMHSWWVSHVKDAGISIDGSVQYRQYYACENGCGSRKRCLIDTETGERWGWSRIPGENYGTDGGWTKADFVLEWINRQRRHGVIPPVQHSFTFDDETMQLIRASRKKAVG